MLMIPCAVASFLSPKMNYLPVVNRELRVAARKRSTFWVRVAAAIGGLLLGTGCLILSRLQGIRSAEMGSVLFNVLTWICLAAGLSAGLFFTSDCLSEEKREGTLGLLFLTELRGYDVAMGKLLATSLRSFYALLAILPIVAITQLMGGIAGMQYWKSALALVNALFVSLSAGIFISALSRDSQKSLAATLLMLLLIALGGPLTDAIMAGVKRRGFQPGWSVSSPAYVLVTASAWGRSAYWGALALTHGLGWTMFGLACVLVPRTWQERKRAATSTSRGWSYAWRYGGARRRRRLARRLLERHPVTWLASRERWQCQGLWAMSILSAGGFAALLFSKLPREAWIVWNYVGGLFTLILYLWAASQASRLFVDGRRSGLLELLLATPVTEREIVRGQWRAWLGLFGVPVLLLLSIHVVGATLAQLSFHRIAAQASAAMASAVTNQSSGTVVTGATVTISVNTSNTFSMSGPMPSSNPIQQFAVAAGAAAATALSTAANLLALCWFGMWMGMTSKSANLATLKTLLFVQVVPWFVIAFGSSIFVAILMAGWGFTGRTMPSANWLFWLPLLSTALAAVVALAKDIGFIVWSRKKLLSSLREQAAAILGQPRSLLSPALSPPMAVPPVIGARGGWRQSK